MKKVEAIIPPSKLDEVKEALAKVGIQGLTAWEVRGFGQGQTELYRGSEHVVFMPKIRLEIVLDDFKTTQIVTAIKETTRAGYIGDDDQIVVLPVDEVVRIRTGERGSAAI
jgi:nitrogen regulatory protein P-II 1